MRKLAAVNPWVAGVLSWLIATGLVSGVYMIWTVTRGQTVNWTIVRDAALMAAPLALFRAWRDSGRREQ